MRKETFEIALKDYDVENLDMLESLEYSHHIKHMDKIEALKVIINTVEGDFRQLSEGLQEIAIQYCFECYES